MILRFLNQTADNGYFYLRGKNVATLALGSYNIEYKSSDEGLRADPQIIHYPVMSKDTETVVVPITFDLTAVTIWFSPDLLDNPVADSDHVQLSTDPSTYTFKLINVPKCPFPLRVQYIDASLKVSSRDTLVTNVEVQVYKTNSVLSIEAINKVNTAENDTIIILYILVCVLLALSPLILFSD